MSPVYETGHEINLANLETLISRCIGFGENYNPTKNTIKIDALSASLNNAKQVFLNLRTAKTAYDNACNAREAAFAPFRKLATRIINAFHAAVHHNMPSTTSKQSTAKYKANVPPNEHTTLPKTPLPNQPKQKKYPFHNKATTALLLTSKK